MLNLIKKTTLTALAATVLVGGLSASAQAQSATTLFAASSIQTQQNVLRTNNVALRNIGIRANKITSRRSLDRDFDIRGLNVSTFGQSRINDNRFGQSRIGVNDLGSRQFGQSRVGPNILASRTKRKRQFTPAPVFSSHVNSNQNFQKAKILTSRF